MFMVDSAPLLVTWSMMAAPRGWAQCAHCFGSRFMRDSNARGLNGFIFVFRMFSHRSWVGTLAAWDNHPFTVCDGHTVRRAGGETRIDMSSYLIALTHEEHTPRPEGTSNRYKRPKACMRTAQRYGSTPLVCCCLPITDAHENNMRHANALLQKCEKAGSVFVQHFSQDKRSTARSTSTQQMSFRQR